MKVTKLHGLFKLCQVTSDIDKVNFIHQSSDNTVILEFIESKARITGVIESKYGPSIKLEGKICIPQVSEILQILNNCGENTTLENNFGPILKIEDSDTSLKASCYIDQESQCAKIFRPKAALIDGDRIDMVMDSKKIQSILATIKSMSGCSKININTSIETSELHFKISQTEESESFGEIKIPVIINHTINSNYNVNLDLDIIQKVFDLNKKSNTVDISIYSNILLKLKFTYANDTISTYLLPVI